MLDTYNRVYNINRPLTTYFQEPWATRLQANPFAKMSQRARQLFTAPFRAGILNKTDEPIAAAFRDNDIYDWRPRAPLALFHGTADDYVPFFNSENAYKAMRARGATQVELHPIKGGNHFSSVPQYTLEALAFLVSFRILTDLLSLKARQQKRPASNLIIVKSPPVSPVRMAGGLFV